MRPVGVDGAVTGLAMAEFIFTVDDGLYKLIDGEGDERV